jgi:hypothetical protein
VQVLQGGKGSRMADTRRVHTQPRCRGNSSASEPMYTRQFLQSMSSAEPNFR